MVEIEISSLGKDWGGGGRVMAGEGIAVLVKPGFGRCCSELYVLGRIRGRNISPAPREDQPKRSCTRRGRTASQAVMRMAYERVV